MIQIKSNRLDVGIAELGEFYCGSRFDWTGFITQITLDCKHTFCGSESEIESNGSGGHGFCGEFGITEPVGFEDAKPGEKFPKLGGGLLTRPDESPFSFMSDYMIDPFDMSVFPRSEYVRFLNHPRIYRGYSARLDKTVIVSENHLEIRSTLSNVGKKTLRTNEYNHNFIALNRQRIGPSHRHISKYREETPRRPFRSEIRNHLEARAS